MEVSYEAKCLELSTRTHQIVFHGTDERSNVNSILQHGFDKNLVKRVRRGFSPAWTSSSFDKVRLCWVSLYFRLSIKIRPEVGGQYHIHVIEANNEVTDFETLTGFFLRPQARSHSDEQTAPGKLLAGQLQARHCASLRHQGECWD